MANELKVREPKGISPRRPLMGLTRRVNDLERLMDEFFDRRTRAWWPERWSLPAVLDIEPPVVDLYADKDDLVVKAELPGIEKQDIEVNVTDHTLTIKGEKKKAEEIEEEKYYQSERSFGSFHRSLELPSDIQAEKAKASFKNGILEVRLPKSEVAKAKEIKVPVEEGPITSVGQN
jgi:HSP20 family protein